MKKENKDYLKRAMKCLLEESLRMTLFHPQYCGHEDNEQTLEDKLWDYVDGLMGEVEEEKFFKTAANCHYCITKLISIQTTLKVVWAEKRHFLKELENMKEKAEELRLEARAIEKLKRV